MEAVARVTLTPLGAYMAVPLSSPRQHMRTDEQNLVCTHVQLPTRGLHSNSLCTLLGDAIVKVLYKAGKSGAGDISGSVSVTKGTKYAVKIEVLRNDLGSSDERVKSIKIDGKEVGKKSGYACNPDGGDYDCTFFDCKSQITDNLVVTAASSTLKLALDFEGHSWACDCDTSSWKCSRENAVKGRAAMEAVARVTLTPQSNGVPAPPHPSYRHLVPAACMPTACCLHDVWPSCRDVSSTHARTTSCHPACMLPDRAI